MAWSGIRFGCKRKAVGVELLSVGRTLMLEVIFLACSTCGKLAELVA